MTITPEPWLSSTAPSCGRYDYMLKIVAPDMASYQDFLSGYLLKIGVVRTVNTSFALKQQKNTTVLPLDEI